MTAFERLASFELIAPSASVADSGAHAVVAKGVGVGRRSVVARVVTTNDEASHLVDAGEPFIWLTTFTSPGDLAVLRHCSGVITRVGGLASHGAIVAQQLGLPAICGVGEAKISGVVELVPEAGEVRAHRSGVVDSDPDLVVPGDVLETARAVLGAEVTVSLATDRVGEMSVSAPVGLCRMEYLLGDVVGLVAEVRSGSDDAFVALVETLGVRVATLLDLAGSHPVKIRLLDVEGPDVGINERNPMMGLRGIRLMVDAPRVLFAQIQGIVEAMTRSSSSGDVVLIAPMLSLSSEFRWLDEFVAAEVAALQVPDEVSRRVSLGFMIETPRAAMCAGEFAHVSSSMSIGSNDLTQFMFGASRDDASEIVRTYVNAELVRDDPFVTLDEAAVLRMIALAIETARAVNPELTASLCGVHALDRASIRGALLVGVDEFVVPAIYLDEVTVMVAQELVKLGRRA